METMHTMETTKSSSIEHSANASPPFGSPSDTSLVEKYIEHMTVQERKAYGIAQQHLQSSFNLLKSNGFIQWSKAHGTGTGTSS